MRQWFARVNCSGYVQNQLILLSLIHSLICLCLLICAETSEMLHTRNLFSSWLMFCWGKPFKILASHFSSRSLHPKWWDKTADERRKADTGHPILHMRKWHIARQSELHREFRAKMVNESCFPECCYCNYHRFSDTFPFWESCVWHIFHSLLPVGVVRF